LHFATLDAAIAAGWQYARRENGELEIRQQDCLIRLRSAIPAGDHVERTVTESHHRASVDTSFIASYPLGPVHIP
jgi:hypothetical protein